MDWRHAAWRLSLRAIYAALWIPATVYGKMQEAKEGRRLEIEHEIEKARAEQDLLELRNGDWS